MYEPRAFAWARSILSTFARDPRSGKWSVTFLSLALKTEGNTVCLSMVIFKEIVYIGEIDFQVKIQSKFWYLEKYTKINKTQNQKH